MSYVPSPAGFWKRYVAYFVDMVLLSTVLNVLMGAVMSVVGLGQSMSGVLDEATHTTSPEAWLLQNWGWIVGLTVASIVAYAVLAAVYFIWLEGSAKHATFGKQLAGIRVTALDGGAPTRGQVVGRFFASGLSWLTLNLGHALAAWTPQGRALHDYVAGTRVENVGILAASGMIAGEALTGLVTATFAWMEKPLPVVFERPSYLVGLVVLALIAFVLVRVPISNAGRADEPAPPAAIV